MCFNKDLDAACTGLGYQFTKPALSGGMNMGLRILQKKKVPRFRRQYGDNDGKNICDSKTYVYTFIGIRIFAAFPESIF